MKALYRILIFSLLFICLSAKAQSNMNYETNPDRMRTNQWIFGSKNLIKFYPNNQSDTFIFDFSGSSAIFSNKDGRVVLYSDGSTVWDSLNTVIASGLNGKSGIKGIVFYYYEPDNIVYLFNSKLTYTSFKISTSGIRVIEKNKKFALESDLQPITLINSKDNTGAWLLTSNTNIGSGNSCVVAYRLSNGKIINCPVVSEFNTFIGYNLDLTFSIDGKFLLIGELSTSNNKPTMICHFNQENGKATKLFALKTDGMYSGAAFSPDSRVIYRLISKRPMDVIQFFPEDSLATALSIKLEPIQSGLFKMRNTLNDDIVLSLNDSNYLSTIEYPNDFNGYSVLPKGIITKESSSTFELPNFNQSYFYTPSIDFAYKYDCISNSIVFEGRDTFNADTHQWTIGKPGNPIEASNNTKSITHLFQDTGDYQIVFIASKGSRSDTTIKTITIYPKVGKDFLGRDTVYENGVSFSRTLAAPPGMHCYFWHNDSSTSSYFSTDTIGAFVCTMTNNAFCMATDTLTISYCINNLPVPVLTRNGDTLKISSTNADSFIWYRNNTHYKTTHDTFLKLTDTGSYRVEAAKKGYCNKSSSVYHINKLGVKAYQLSDFNIQLYPNPSDGEIFIVSDKIFELKVYDIAGKLITSHTNIDRLSLPKGVYFFWFEVDGVRVVEKVVVF